MSAGAARLTVGVFPAAERDRLQRLLGALEQAYPVRFEGRGEGELGALDAVLELGQAGRDKRDDATDLPVLSLLHPEPGEAGAAATLEVSGTPELSRPLHGAELPDAHLGSALAAGVSLATPAGAGVLAACASNPIWTRTKRRQTALLAPAELGRDEALRERLRDGRSAALLPLVHFLRELTAAIGWQPPPARATLLFDDPNLHWPSYGFVKLGSLAADARAHGYHAALATIPLDGWFAHPTAVRALRESQGAISLLVHGNDHYGAELGRIEREADAVALAAQALRRAQAFERRSGVHVDPVMVPPHEECSRATVAGLRRCGFEAITMTRPFPWLAPPPLSWLTRPTAAGPLAGWRPSDRAEGLAVFLRHPFIGRSAAELALRAFLGQPLILYGHQADLREGLGVLRETAADVNRLGPTRWCSLEEIAAGSYETRRSGSRLAVRPLTRRAVVEVPDGVEELLIEAPETDSDTTARLLVDRQPRRLGEPLTVAPSATVELQLRANDELDPANVAPPRRQPLAFPRRALSETRDRLAPLLSRDR